MRAREILATRFFKGRIDDSIFPVMKELKANLKKAVWESLIPVSPILKKQIHKAVDHFFS